MSVKKGVGVEELKMCEGRLLSNNSMILCYVMRPLFSV